ncbi:STAS domain-containing protein [Streptomyces sp. NPDC001089]
MTPSHPTALTLTVETEAGTVLVHVAGDLDFESSDELLKTVERWLGEHRDTKGEPADLRIEFSALDTIDTMGLSILLMIRRMTDLRGVRLHLDERPPVLERLLNVTGTLHHLTAPRARIPGEQGPVERQSADPSAGEQRPGTG